MFNFQDFSDFLAIIRGIDNFSCHFSTGNHSKINPFSSQTRSKSSSIADEKFINKIKTLIIEIYYSAFKLSPVGFNIFLVQPFFKVVFEFRGLDSFSIPPRNQQKCNPYVEKSKHNLHQTKKRQKIVRDA